MRPLDVLRRAEWLTRERALVLACCFAMLTIGVVAWDAHLHTIAGLTDRKGEQLARDFINYWSGARLAAGGRAALAYHTDFFHAFQANWMGMGAEFKIYSYPPIMMLLTAPLAALSFVPALVMWVCVGIVLCTWPLSRLWSWRVAAIALLAMPASLLNLIAGQNGFFTAALLGGGLMLLQRRPVLAGLLLGLLAYKPQMGLLIPVALIAGRHWRTVLAAAAMVAVLLAASLLVHGVDAWVGFIHQMTLQRHLMELGARFWFRMPTAFAAVREAGGSVAAAYTVQVASTALAAAAVAFLWRAEQVFEIKAAGLVVGLYLVTPYAWDYDTIALVYVVAWLIGDASRRGFLPWERLVLTLLLVLPVPMILLSLSAGLQVGPLILWLALALLVRRTLATRAAVPVRGGLSLLPGAPIPVVELSPPG